MKITIETIPHDRQRIPGQVGDWQIGAQGNITIRVSETENWRCNAAIAVHELVEALLCQNDGVSEADVDAFDMGFEEDRCVTWSSGEPGDDPAAPYRRQHCFAAAVERMLIAAMDMPWAEYEAAVEAL